MTAGSQPIPSSKSSWLYESPKASSSFSMKQALIIGGVIAAALVMQSWDSLSAMGGGTGLGYAIAAGRWANLTAAGRVEAWDGTLLDGGRWLISWPLSLPGKVLAHGVESVSTGQMGHLTSVADLAEENLMKMVAPKLVGHLTLTQALSRADLAETAPRLLGLRDPDLVSTLRLLPREQQLSLLKKWLSLSRYEGTLEKAIVSRLAPTLNPPPTLAELLKRSDLAEVAPGLVVSSEKVLEFLGHEPRIRAELAMRLLSVQERTYIVGHLGKLLETKPEAVEREILRCLAPKIYKPLPLHQILQRTDLQEVAPRLLGVADPTVSGLRALLSPDEMLSDIPTLIQFQGSHVSVVTFFWLVDLADAVHRGRVLTVGPDDSPAIQMGLPIGLMAINWLQKNAPKMWEDFQEYIEPKAPAPRLRLHPATFPLTP